MKKVNYTLASCSLGELAIGKYYSYDLACRIAHFVRVLGIKDTGVVSGETGRFISEVFYGTPGAEAYREARRIVDSVR